MRGQASLEALSIFAILFLMTSAVLNTFIHQVYTGTPDYKGMRYLLFLSQVDGKIWQYYNRLGEGQSFNWTVCPPNGAQLNIQPGYYSLHTDSGTVLYTTNVPISTSVSLDRCTTITLEMANGKLEVTT